MVRRNLSKKNFFYNNWIQFIEVNSQHNLKTLKLAVHIKLELKFSTVSGSFLSFLYHVFFFIYDNDNEVNVQIKRLHDKTKRSKNMQRFVKICPRIFEKQLLVKFPSLGDFYKSSELLKLLEEVPPCLYVQTPGTENHYSSQKNILYVDVFSSYFRVGTLPL